MTATEHPATATPEDDEWISGYKQAQAKWTGMRPEDYPATDDH